MGFAGQVFAAKMAVGLAVPSTGALSRTGSMLAKGAAGIYSALNSQRKTQAAKRVSEAQAEVDRLSKIASGAAETQSQVIAKEAEAGMRRLSAAGSSAADVLQKGGVNAFRGMSDAMGSEGAKLWEGVDSAKKPIERLMILTTNYSKLTKTEQKNAIANSKAYVKAREQAVQADKDKLAAQIQERNDLTKGWQRITKGRQKQLDEIDARIKKTERSIEVGRELRDEAYKEADVLKDVAVQAGNASRTVGDKLTKANSDLEEATEELNEALSDEDKIIKDVNTSAADFGAKVVGVANEMKNNFNDVLIESTAALTAFYYKLNQNTEALMEFERELINANSVWQETDEVLFAAGEQVTQFGQTFGLEMQNGATGLYQLASAGLTAQESMDVLGNTLKLSMAVQGDHNTIAKLTTQTIRGFDMEMSQSAEVTDKFAHAIQKSLIEYEDLSSAVKFALPFFTSTGQSIDQLLGSLQVLTNRALEAGIAGRGLRQALAQFAKHADSNDAAFKKMGISVLNAEGNMRQLSDIAADFAEVVGEDTVNNTELLTTLIEDLNVRGATAFVHLVQASDEFTQAVEETAGAGGELDKMITEQNSSLTSQLQILKNNVQFIFQYADATYVAEGYMNEFHKTVSLMIADLQGMIVTGEDGEKQLTDFGLAIQDIAVSGMKALHELMLEVIPVIKEFSKEGFMNVEMIRLYTLPLRIVVDLLKIMGPEFTKMMMTFYVYNKLLPITTALEVLRNIAMMWYLRSIHQTIAAKVTETGVTELSIFAKVKETLWTWNQTLAEKAHTAAKWLGITAIWGAITGLASYLGVQSLATAATWGATAAATAFWIAVTAGLIVIVAVIVAMAKMAYESEYFQNVMKSITEPGGHLYQFKQSLGFILDIMVAIASATGAMISGIAAFGMKAVEVGKVAYKYLNPLTGPINTAKKLGSFFGFGASGAYIQAMATGGAAAGGKPYIVGERGPELFMPNQSGKVLNNSATNHIMQQSADSGFAGVGGGMVVSNLTVESAEMNQSNLNIDSFAGNPAMRRTV